jgi:hypothetical protein
MLCIGAVVICTVLHVSGFCTEPVGPRSTICPVRPERTNAESCDFPRKRLRANRGRIARKDGESTETLGYSAIPGRSAPDRHPRAKWSRLRTSLVRFLGGPHGRRPGPTVYTVVECSPFSLVNVSKRSYDFSQEGGKRVPTAEFCLPPSGAKSHYSGMQRQRLYFVTSRSKPRPTRLGLMYFFMDISFWQSLIGSVRRAYYRKTRSVRETMASSHPVGNPRRQPPHTAWQVRYHL